MRRRTRADANQKEIDRELRAVGASVLPLGDVGKGCPDRLIFDEGCIWAVQKAALLGPYFVVRLERAGDPQPVPQAECYNRARTPKQSAVWSHWLKR